MPLPDSVKLLPSLLKEKNYYSGLIRKSHLGPEGDRQFDYVNSSLDSFEQFVEQSQNRPFFLWVGFTDPHRDYQDSIFSADSQSPEDVMVRPYWVDDLPTRKDLANYYDEIRRMDQQIGYYVASLKEKNLLENTIIIFISDNGAPFPREKGTVYDAGIKTPLVIHWPGTINPNQRTDALISVVDLAPSLLQLIGLKPTEEMQGLPIENLFGNGETESRDYIFAERNWHNCDEHIRSVRTDRYKLIKNAYLELPHGTAADISSSPTFKSLLASKQENQLNTAQLRLFEYPRPEYELYDLQNDPYELNNLAAKDSLATIREELKEVLATWMQETNDYPSDERRRQDNTDRFTGVKFDQTKLPPRIQP
jgi:arylsulfatase A-like enzyme